jgi:hypothetical protein
MSNSPEPVAFAVMRADDTIAQMFDTNAEAQEYAGKLNRRLPGDYRVEPLVLRSALSEERGVRETLEKQRADDLVRLTARCSKALATLTRYQLRDDSMVEEPDGHWVEFMRLPWLITNALHSGAVRAVEMPSPPAAAGDLVVPAATPRMSEANWPASEYVFNAEYNNVRRLSGKCSAHAVRGKGYHCDRKATVVVTVCEGSQNGVEYLSKLEVCTQHQQVFERSMDWRATRPLQIDNLAPSPPEGEPTQEPNYEAAVEAFNQRVAYWAPEWISSPEHVYEAIAAAVDAAQERAVSETEEER